MSLRILVGLKGIRKDPKNSPSPPKGQQSSWTQKYKKPASYLA